MLCNTVSYYPDGIDKMLFFQDNNLEKIDIINTYNNLIAQGNYTEVLGSGRIDHPESLRIDHF